MDLTVRAARAADADAVAAIARDTWPDRDIDDYVPRVFPEWVADDDPDRVTLVADDGDGAVAVVGGHRLTAREAWVHGLRVHPDHRGSGVGSRLVAAVFDWARDRGAAVCRSLVFSWNVAGLSLARSVGFEPRTAFRWAETTADADADPSATVDDDPGAGWTFWVASDARDHLRGLALDDDRAWSLSELREPDLARAADEDGLFVVSDGGTRGVALRTRVFERGGGDGDGRDADDGGSRWAEYAVGAWADLDAARAIVRAVERDAAARGARRARILIPETARAVTDAAVAGASVSDGPNVVFAADLTDPAV